MNAPNEKVAKDSVAPDGKRTGQHFDMHFLSDVKLLVTVELGRNTVEIGRLLSLKKGSVFEVEKLPEEPLDVRVNNRLVAQGEAVIVNDKFGVRVTQIVSPEGELENLTTQMNK